MKLQITNYKLQTVWNLVFCILFLFVIWYLVLGASPASAQAQPELMITWKANSYVPSNYQGKVLPADGTRVDMAVELIDGGKLANISRNQIRWLVNGELIQSGIGLKNFSFTANAFRGDQVIKVIIANYRGADQEKDLVIPIAKPQAVIVGGPEIFEALLYFFNLRNLSQADFRWSVNGIDTIGFVSNPNFVTIDAKNISAGDSVSLQVRARNTLRPLEIASANKSLILK